VRSRGDRFPDGDGHDPGGRGSRGRPGDRAPADLVGVPRAIGGYDGGDGAGTPLDMPARGDARADEAWAAEPRRSAEGRSVPALDGLPGIGARTIARHRRSPYREFDAHGGELPLRAMRPGVIAV
jgi:hypothetical protein